MILNKIYNIDCIEGMKQLRGNSIDLIITDIPYDEVNNNKSCLDRSKYKGQLRKYFKGNSDELTFNLNQFIKECDRICKGSIYIFCGINQAGIILNYFKNEREKYYMARLCIWKKNNPTPSNGQYMWLSGTELCVFAKRRKTIFNQHCKSNIWEFNSGKSKIHPTQKPLELFKYLITSSSNEKDIVLDTCMGSGTTAVACKQLNRNFIGFEISSKYCEIIKDRLEKVTTISSTKRCFTK